MYQASSPASAGHPSLPWQEMADESAPAGGTMEAAQLLAQLRQVLGPVGMTLSLVQADRDELLATSARRAGATPSPANDAQDGHALRLSAPLSGDKRLVLQLHPLGAMEHGQLVAARPFIDLALRTYAAGIANQDRAQRHIAGLETALDQSIYGILLLRCDGAMLFANQTAQRLLGASDGIRRAGRTISASELGDAIKLQVAIDHVCRGDACQGEHPVVALRRRNGKRPLLACVSPVQDRGSAGTEASAVLRIIDPDCRVGPLIEPVCAHYRLSAVESRLACFIATGLTLEEAAVQLRIKEQTARSYLKQVFLKTETNRQADLVRLLLSSAIRTLASGRMRFL